MNKRTAEALLNRIKKAIEIPAAYLGLLWILTFDLDEIIEYFKERAGGLI